MKLRQKLAVALASAMVVTSVPVVTMAASTNSLVKETLKVAEDTVFYHENSTANALKINFKDNNGAEEVFYLKLTNAKWNDTAIAQFAEEQGEDGIQYNKQNSTLLQVKVPAAKATSDTRLPILAEVTGGEATVEIVTMSGNTTISKGSFVFATTSTANVEVAVDATTLPNVYTSGTIADIVITETMTGAFGSLKDNKIELEIDNDDYKFASLASAELKYEYGFDTANTYTLADIAELSSDKRTITITLPKNLKADGIGQLRIKGLGLTATTKTPEETTVKVDVYGDALEAKTTLEVAKVTGYGSTITIEEDDKVEIKAGQTKDVVFTLAETEQGSFVQGREVEFTIDKGYIMNQKTTDGKYDEELTRTELAKLVTLTNTTSKEALEIVDVTVKDKKVVGFTVEMKADNTKVDKIKVEMPITAGLQEEGDVTVSLAGRAIEEEVSATITTIKAGISVTTEAAALEVGVKGQVAGKITVKEANKADLKAGEEITITLPSVKGITVTDEPTVTVVDGDITIGEVKVDTVENKDKEDEVVITIQVKRASRTASTIEIAGIEFTVDRTVAEGAYDVVLGGKAISETETLTVEDFLAIGTVAGDVASNGLAKGTASFSMNASTYTVNGETVEMDGQAYIQAPGYTMVPVKYVAKAFGVKDSDILYSNGTATIFAGNRTIQLTAGSNVAIVNGASITMGTAVAVKDGRTYAPVGEVARMLGIATEWDSATKTAKFENK